MLTIEKGVFVGYEEKKTLKDGDSENYIVKEGDTFGSIAEWYKNQGCNVTGDQIKRDNIELGGCRPGEILKIKCR